MVTSKLKNSKAVSKKTNVLLGILGSIIAIVIVAVLLITQPWKPDYLSGKYEKQFKDYIYSCLDGDETGWNSYIGELYGSWWLVACTCSYIEYHNYYGDKDLPKREVITGDILSLKKKETYDAMSVFADDHLTSSIKSCIEKEQNDWRENYGENFRKKYGYSV